MTKVDENIQTAQNMLNWIVERCYELEEENKKLKIENAKLKDRIITDENFEEKLDKENKNLKETIKDHQLYEEKLEHRIIEFEELLHWE